MSTQQRFNPVQYGFKWTEDWYEFAHKAAHRQALADRNAEAKRLRKAGHVVRVSTDRNQLMSRGGIGSGNPHIELLVSVYSLDVVS